MTRGIDLFLDKLIIVPAVMIGLVLIICAAMVFLRNVLIGAFNWSDEAMRYLMVYATFLALPILVQRKKNITIDLTDLIFPNSKRGTFLFHLAAEVMTLLCCAILIPVSIKFVQMNMTGYSPAMQIPYPVVYSCIPLGLVLSTVASLNNIYKMLFAGKEGAESC